MIDVEVFSRAKVLDYANKSHSLRTASISICDVNSTIPLLSNIRDDNGIVKSIILNFNDTDKLDSQCITDEDATKIVSFVHEVEKEDIDFIIVNCEAGISRSSGVAAAISKYLINDDNQFFGNRYVPNIACYRKVLNKFFES